MMNPLKVLLFSTLLMAILVNLSSATTKHDDKINHKEAEKQQELHQHYGERRHYFHTKKHPHHPTIPHWVNPRVKLTCDRFPRACHIKGSPGPDCCKKKCVNVKTDRLNCGMCGLKCRYPEICCNGRCVNPNYDRHHCGGCHNKCNRGNFCNNGFCSYA